MSKVREAGNVKREGKMRETAAGRESFLSLRNDKFKGKMRDEICIKGDFDF